MYVSVSSIVLPMGQLCSAGLLHLNMTLIPNYMWRNLGVPVYMP